MQRLQAFKFELRPNGKQERDMRRFAGACRFVFNKALDLQQKRYAEGQKKLNYAELCKALTAWRREPEIAWLADAPIHPLQQSLKDLERAYQNFFAKRAAFPNFKKKGRSASFRYPDAKQFKLDAANGRIFFPKLGWMKLRLSRPVLGQLKNATVGLSAGKWFVSLQTEQEVANPIPKATSAIGVDLGVARFATFSDGTFVEPLSSFKRHEARLARAQRRLSRKVKFSSNWRKAKAKVQRIHARIANARRDFLHKTTTALSQNHALVVVEDLQVKSMSRSAKGTRAQPGKHVRAKSGLNRSILDQGWSEFRRQLEYKMAWVGGLVLAVPPHHTSQTCPACGHVHAGNRATQASFKCLACDFEGHADHVGALNVLARGHRVMACGGDVSRSGSAKNPNAAPAKQEPAEAIGCGAIHA